MKLGIVAGEASGDLLGAELIRAFHQMGTNNLTVTGVIGEQMMSIGCHALFNVTQLSMMGLEPLWHLPRLFKMRQKLYRYFFYNRPDVFIGIDAPDFNLGLENKLRCYGIPIVHYVSPSCFAWRQYRVHKIKRSVDLMLTLFPFEADFYRQHQVPVAYVGHPLADLIPLDNDPMMARQALGLSDHGPYVALLPGSRAQELCQLTKIFLLAADKIWQQNRTIQFISSFINQEQASAYQVISQQLVPHLPIHIFVAQSHSVLAAADVVLIKSGTGTLEAMLFKKPMVIAYRLSPWLYPLVKAMVQVPYFGLPNLLANKLLVPECIQSQCTPAILANAVLTYLDNPAKQKVLKEHFTMLHQQLRCHAAKQAASAIINLLN